MFYIVEMTDAGTAWVAIVPRSYFHEGKSAWPKGKDAATIVKSGKPPKQTYPRYDARILHAYETYDEARKKIVAAEQTSDLSGAENNDLPNKRARIRQPPMPVGSDGDSDDSENERVVKKAKVVRPIGSSNVNSADMSTLPPMPLLNLPEAEHIGPDADLPAGGQTSSFGDGGGTSSLLNEDTPPAINTVVPAPLRVDVEYNQVSHNAIGGLEWTISDTSTPIFVTNIQAEQWNKLLQDVSNIKITLNNIDKKLDNILTKDSAPKGPPIIKNPFEKLDEFTTFDESLLNNDELQLKLKCHLVCGVGGKVPEVVSGMLKKLFTDKLALDISLKGYKGNYNFSATVSFKVMSDSAMDKIPDVTEKEISKAMISWFQHASDRLKTKKNSSA
ncbi:uncharacterized protein LOC118433619 [Folsomia candida]|nr:uncharacterized protein LOC118433619 [Folsomia candida]